MSPTATRRGAAASLRRGFPGRRSRGAGALPSSSPPPRSPAGALHARSAPCSGLGAAAILGYALCLDRRLSLKRFFLVTNALLVLFAAGLVAHAVHEFNEAGLIPP